MRWIMSDRQIQNNRIDRQHGKKKRKKHGRSEENEITEIFLDLVGNPIKVLELWKIREKRREKERYIVKKIDEKRRKPFNRQKEEIE